MDVVKALDELYREKMRLDVAIAKLEAGQRGDVSEMKGAGKRRGRKSMSAEERRAVSQRMAEYWAARKAGNGADSDITGMRENMPEGRPEQDRASA